MSTINNSRMTYYVKIEKATTGVKQETHLRTYQSGKVASAGKGAKKTDKPVANLPTVVATPVVTEPIKVYKLGISAQRRAERIQKYGEDIKSFTELVDTLDDTNIDQIREVVKNNEIVKNYLKEVYSDLKKRPEGQGKEIRLTPEQYIATMEVGKYVLISAGKNGVNNPEEHQNKDEAYFKGQHTNLKNELINKGYVINDALGKYGGSEEPSIMVMVHDSDEQELEQIGEKYQQHTIIYTSEQTNKMVKTYGEAKGETLDGFGYSPQSAVAEDDFTRVYLSTGKPIKFALNFNFEANQNFFSR